MEDVAIADTEDPRVEDYRGLGDGERIRTRGLFIAEGRFVVQRLLEDGRYGVRSLLVSPAARQALDDVLSQHQIAARIPSVYIAPTDAFEAITGFKFHRGCLALAERPCERTLESVVEGASLLVVLEGVTDPDNVGSVFRNAAAFGADAVLLSSTCCDPLYRKAIRTSMGATLRVPFARLSDWIGTLHRLRQARFAIVALTPRQTSTSLDEFVAMGRQDRLALAVGTEGSGLSPEVEALADHRVCIPMRADVDSLNLSVATGIALSRITGR